MSLVRLTTGEAIKKGECKLQKPGSAKMSSVDLLATMRAQACVQWCGGMNLRMPGPIPTSSHLPPLMISDSSAIDIAVNLRRRAGPDHTISLVVEVHDFDEATG